MIIDDTVEVYKGFRFKKSNKEKQNEKIRINVDLSYETIEKPYDGALAPEKLEETLAQAVLMKVMPDYEIIKMDNGSKDSQMDLFAKSTQNGHEVAIEITQFVDNNFKLIKDNSHGQYPAKYTTRDWNLNVNNNEAPEIHDRISSIDKTLLEIEQGFQPIDALKKFSISCATGNANNTQQKDGSEKGSIKINLQGNFGFSIGKEAILLKEILAVAHQECVKKDNRKKLSSSISKENHIFISIGFSFDKGLALKGLFEYWHLFKNTRLNKTDLPKEYEIIFNTVDVVWIARLYDWTEAGIMAFSLVKITKENDEIIFEIVFNKEPYL